MSWGTHAIADCRGGREVVPGLVELEVAGPPPEGGRVVGVRGSAKNTKRQGTAVIKKYQMDEFDASKLAVPEQVSVAMDGIAADLREGLLALAVGAGLQVLQQLMEADVAAACGARGKHDPDRTA